MSESAEDEFGKVLCVTCGIEFKLTGKIILAWQKNNKTFYCPNGHTLGWEKPPSSDKVIKSFRKQIEELKEELKFANEKVKELETELEIWKPSSPEIK